MKFLLDQNISFKVARLIADAFGEVQHVKNLNLVDASDVEIWSFAKANGYTIITFDSDFIDLSALRGTLPKIVWLRFGNSTNLKLANKLIANKMAIIDFVDDNTTEILFLELT